MHVAIPSAFDFDEWTLPEHRAGRDGVHLLFNRVILGMERLKGQAVPISYRQMKNWFTTRSARSVRAAVVNRLVETGWLTCDRSYVVGAKAFAYRIGPAALWNGELSLNSVLVGKSLSDRLLARRKVQFNRKLNRTHGHLRDWLARFGIDYAKALPDCLVYPQQKFILAECQMRSVQSGEWWFSVGKAGRVNTNLTNLHRIARQHVTYLGERLVSTDVSTCQPLLLSISLNSCISYCIKFNSDSVVAGGMGHSSIYDTTEGDTFLKSENGVCLYDITSIQDQALEFSKLCQTGRLWDHLVDWVARSGTHKHTSGDTLCAMPEVQTQYTRDGVKRECMRIINRLDTRGVPSPVLDYLTDRFPILLDYLDWLKRDDHREVARLLQRMESDIMVRQVCGRLARQYPDVPVFTVHDCIVSTRQHAPLVARLIRRAFRRQGVRVGLKVSK